MNEISSIPKKQVSALIDEIGTGKTVLEIGSYRGKTASKIAKQGNKVHCIEPFIGGYNDKESCSKEMSGENDVGEDFRKNTRGLNITLHKAKSEEILPYFIELIDVLLIDGEHTYKALQTDFKFKRFLRKGGILAFHGYSNKYPEVRWFVDEFIKPKYKFVKKVGGLVIFKNEPI